MISFKAEIEKFDAKGDKTGWSYIFIPFTIANQLNAGEKRSYRVKGKLDGIEIEGMALTPMGEGDFILALKADLRKKLKKEEGAVLEVELAHHADFKIDIPEDLELCLMDEPNLLERFLDQPKSHQNYFYNWLNGAKTIETRAKRIAMIVDAMVKGYNYSQMIRASQGKPINRE